MSVRVRVRVATAREVLGNTVILYTTDGGSVDYMTRGTLKGQVFTTGDFGSVVTISLAISLAMSLVSHVLSHVLRAAPFV